MSPGLNVDIVIFELFKINKKKHREIFYSLAQYIYEKYGLSVDPTGINESRTRYVTFDPNIYINPKETPVFNIIYERPKREKIENITVNVAVRTKSVEI